MDTAKLRIIAGAGAGIFGFIATCGLSVAGWLALVPVMGAPLSALIVSSVLLTVALLCAFIFLKPKKSTDKELDQFEHATADLLADLPFDMVANLAEKRPMTASAIAMAAGYLVITNPEGVSKGLQKLADDLM